MATVSAILILGNVLIATWTYYSSYANVRHQAIDDNTVLSAAIDESVYGLMKTGQQSYLDNYLRETSKSKSVKEIRVIRSDALEKELGIKEESRARDDLDRQVLSSGIGMDREISAGQEKTIRHIAPILADNSCRSCHANFKEGAVIAALSSTLTFQKSIDKIQQDLILRSIFQFIVILLVIVAIFKIFDRFVMKPITTIGSFVRKLGNGGLSISTDMMSSINPNDEVGELAFAFEKMHHDLQTKTVSLEELNKSEGKFRAIFDQTFQFIGLLTIEGILTDANRAALQFSGIKESDVLGKPFWETPWWTHSPELQTRLRDAIQRAANGEFVRFEATHTDKDGGLHYVDFSLKPVKNEKGEISMLIPEGRDITERKLAEMEKRSLELLKKTTEIKSNFTAMVSHELRSPLAVIHGSIAAIADGLAGQINEEQRELLNMCEKSIKRLERLINNVLDFQKISSGKMEYNFCDNDIVKTVEEVSDGFKILTAQKGLNFQIKSSGPLPMIQFDKDRIIQVLTNLVGNAIKFTAEGGITVSIQREGHNVHFEVRDTGPGVRAEDLTRLFHPFEQVRPGKRKIAEGSGLGLAITKEIVIAHGGKIWVESDPGRGSIFHFTLPIREHGESA